MGIVGQFKRSGSRKRAPEPKSESSQMLESRVAGPAEPFRDPRSAANEAPGVRRPRPAKPREMPSDQAMARDVGYPEDYQAANIGDEDWDREFDSSGAYQQPTDAEDTSFAPRSTLRKTRDATAAGGQGRRRRLVPTMSDQDFAEGAKIYAKEHRRL
jgi:hypothetical protein